MYIYIAYVLYVFSMYRSVLTVNYTMFPAYCIGKLWYLYL